MRGIWRAAARDPYYTHQGAFNANASLQIVATLFTAAQKAGPVNCRRTAVQPSPSLHPRLTRRSPLPARSSSRVHLGPRSTA